MHNNILTSLSLFTSSLPGVPLLPQMRGVNGGGQRAQSELPRRAPWQVNPGGVGASGPPRARGAHHWFVCLKRGRFLRLHLGLFQGVWSLSGRRFVYGSRVCPRVSEVLGMSAPLIPASAGVSLVMGPPCWKMGSAFSRIPPFKAGTLFWWLPSTCSMCEVALSRLSSGAGDPGRMPAEILFPHMLFLLCPVSHLAQWPGTTKVPPCVKGVLAVK